MRSRLLPGSPLRRSVLALAAVVLLIPGCDAPETANVPPISVPDGFDVQGHRGARGLRPENTLPAFEIALDLGVNTLELDLHLSADSRIIVWHDPVIGPDKCRLADDAPLTIPDPDDPRTHGDRAIAALTVDQLAWYRCDRNPDTDEFPEQSSDPTDLAGGDFRIVTLFELFEFVSAYSEAPGKTESQRAAALTVRFNVETKRRLDDPSTIGDDFNGVDAGPFELALLDLISQFSLEDRVVVQSFDHRSLWAVHAESPDLALAALTPDQFTDLEELVANGASIWSPRHTSLQHEDIAEAHQLGLQVIPWTVNDSAVVAELISMGVDGIITDRPDLVLAHSGS